MPYFERGVTVTVERPGGYTRHGDRLPSVSHTIAGCLAYPRASQEVMAQHRDTVVDTWELLTPVDADVIETDIVVLPGGKRYEVDGAPGGFDSPFTGWRSGQQVVLRAVSG